LPDFEQLRILRETVTDLEAVDGSEVESLAGAQTEDVTEAVQLWFMKLQD